MALSSSPYGNKPGNLENPSQPVGQIQPGSYEMPAMEISGGSEPVAAPQPLPANALPSSGLEPSREPAGDEAMALSALDALDKQESNPESNADEAQALKALETLDAQAAQAKPVGGITGALGVVELPDGEFAVRDGEKLRPLSDTEKRAAMYIATGLRMGGPTIGAMIGGLAGLGGGPAAEVTVPAGAGVGGVIGGEAVDPMAGYFERLSGNKPYQRGIVDRTMEAVLPGAAEAVAGSFVKSGIKNVAKEAAAREFTQGAEIVSEEAAKRVATAEAAGGKLFKNETNADNPSVVAGAEELKSGKYGQQAADEFQAAETARGQENIKKLDDIVEKVGPKQLEEAAKAGDVKKGFDQLSKTYEKRLKDNRDLAQELAIGESYDVSEILKKYPNLRVRGSRILSLKQLDKLVAQTQEEANFGALNRSTSERQFGQLSRELRIQRDSIAADVLEANGKGKVAQQLRSDRDFYSANIENIREAQTRLENDPTYAAKVLLDKDNPRFAEFVAQVLPTGQRQQIAREFVEGLTAKFVDREAKTVSAQAFDKELNSYDPKVLDAILGQGRQELQTFMNYLKIIDKHGLGKSGAASSGVAAKAAKAYLNPKYLSADMLESVVKRIFGKQPKVVDYITGGKEVVPLNVSKPKFSKPNPISALSDKERAAAAGAAGGAAAGTLGALRRGTNAVQDGKSQR